MMGKLQTAASQVLKDECQWSSMLWRKRDWERRVLEPLTFEWRTHISRQCGGRSDISESRNDTLALCAMQYTLRQNHDFCFWLNWKNNLANWIKYYICNKNSHIATYLISNSLLANKLCYSWTKRVLISQNLNGTTKNTTTCPLRPFTVVLLFKSHHKSNQSII